MEERSLQGDRDKILVLVIDYDDDFGRAGIKTPVVGEDLVLRAAISYALERPEDPDLNAIFASLKISRELRGKGFDSEVAIICGDQRGGLRAVERIRLQAAEALKATGSKYLVLVSDGGEDEKVIPVLQSLAPIYYVKTVVIEQARAVEQTYILIWRYFRKVLDEPRLARVLIGYPGVLLIIIGVMAILNLLSLALLTALIFLGIVMTIRGFNLEDVVSRSWKKNPSGVIFTASGLGVLAIALMITWLSASNAQEVYRSNIKIMGSVLENLSWLYGVALALPIMGSMVRRILARSIRAWRHGMLIIIVILFSLVLRDMGSVLLSLPDSAVISDIVAYMWRSNTFQSLLIAVIAIIVTSTVLQLAERIARKAGKLRRESGKEGQA